MKNSILENLPLKIIANIAKLCIEDGFEYFSPYDDYDDNIEILQTATAWTSNNVDSLLDLEFMSKFITTNETLLTKWIDEDLNLKEIAGDLIIPKAKSFQIRYEQWGPATYTEHYSTIWYSYDKSWVSSAMEAELRNGDWNYMDGENVSHDVDDWEPDNERINSIQEFSPVNESVKQKVILENTSELLKQIDKKSLIELRDLINQRLSSF